MKSKIVFDNKKTELTEWPMNKLVKLKNGEVVLTRPATGCGTVLVEGNFDSRKIGYSYHPGGLLISLKDIDQILGKTTITFEP